MSPCDCREAFSVGQKSMTQRGDRIPVPGAIALKVKSVRVDAHRPNDHQRQADAVAASARIFTLTPLNAAVPDSTSIPPEPVMALRFEPGC